MYNPLEDGITHINCYSKGRTQLGRLLSNFAHTPFVCMDGKFTSIEGYWYWLSIGNKQGIAREQLRTLSGFQAKNVGRSLRGDDYPTDNTGFEYRIKKACEAKLTANPHLQSLLKASKLPLVHYYSYGTKNPKIICDGKSDWVWKHYEELRSNLTSILD